MGVLAYRTKADLVYEDLHGRILSGDLAPGTQIAIAEVARQLGVSVIPVREGVTRLISEGFLDSEVHKTAVVKRPTPDDIEELFAIRLELEALAIRSAAEHATRDQLRRVGDLLDELSEAEERTDAVEYGRLNREFHLAIYDSQPYRRLSSMIRQLWDSTDWCKRIFVSDQAYLLASSAEHRGIYDALVDRDGVKAAALLRQQKQRGSAWLLEHITRA